MKNHMIILLLSLALIKTSSILPDRGICIPGLKFEKSYPLPNSSVFPRSVAFSPYGEYIATANLGVPIFTPSDISIYKVDIGGKLIQGISYPLPSDRTLPTSVAFSPNGLFLAAASTGYITIYKMGAGGTLDPGKPFKLVVQALPADTSPLIAFSPVFFHPDIALLTVACHVQYHLDYSLITYMIDMQGTLIGPLSSLNIGEFSSLDITEISSLAYSSDGSLLAVTTVHPGSNNVILYTVSAGGIPTSPKAFPLAANSTPVSAAFSPNGLYFATANYDSHDITVFKVIGGVLSSPGVSYPLPDGSLYPRSITFSPNSSYIATANYGSHNRTIFSIDSQGTVSLPGKSYPLPSGSTNPISVAFSPDGSYLATANFFSRDVTMLTSPICSPWGFAIQPLIDDQFLSLKEE